jgi:RNA recognition motif-containing protein
MGWSYLVYVCRENVLRPRNLTKGGNMKIYVGNLSYDVTEEELRQEFKAFGEVESVNVITDKYSGRPKGFAFVEMPTVSEGQAAITALNGKTLKDRTLTVNAARPRTDDRGGGRGGGFGGGRQRRY